MRITRPVILIGICSCVGLENRRAACRNTWLRNRPDGVEYRFFVGTNKKPFSQILEPDVVQLDAPDDYGGLPQKMMAWYKHSVDYYSYDWLFKCDDDTYIATDRLRDLCNTAYHMIGNLWVYWRGAPSGGAGYMLSRNLVEQFTENEHLMPDWSIEDLVYGKLTQLLDAKMLGDGRLGYGNDNPPTPYNDQITAHWCSIPHMSKIYTEYYGEERDDQAGESGSEAAGEGRQDDEASDGAEAT